MKSLEAAFVATNKALVAFLMAVVFTIVFINVIGRYVFSHSFPWVEELARHLMILGAFCGAGLALRQGRLVAIEGLVLLLPPRAEMAVRWASVAIMFLFMAIVCWLGIKFVQFGWPKETMSTGMSRGVPYISIPLGCGLFLIHLMFFARRFVRSQFEPDAETAGASGDGEL